jgi:2-oxoisovalerate dehydrogenase E2 component (dihydrolipoyl transacylase)
MPDLGEGTVEAEIVRWYAQPGDLVDEDQAIVEVMTDKASVEVPAPVSGRVLSVTGTPGDKVAVGSPLIVFQLLGGADGGPETPAAAAPPGVTGDAPVSAAGTASAPATAAAAAAATTATATKRVMTSPANRRRAREAGISLHTVVGTGPRGRIVQGDLAAAARDRPLSSAPPPAATAAATTEIKVIGLRRLIAERLSEAKRNIPHFAYVEEVDVTELELLRAHLNAQQARGAATLTYLPFVVLALARTLRAFPQCNVRYDTERGVLVRHAAVHVGIATQTPDGLKVPVVRDAGSLSLWALAAAIRAVAERARTNKSPREELSGSTITVTSLGKLGGIVSTPVINAPEVAIVGLNKAVERPVVLHGAIAVRRVMNLSSSFDHRFVDGHDAAAMIQRLKTYLEHPASIFIADPLPGES